MQTVFNAGNNIEGHMIANLLERSGINATVMGEHLQSAVGEIAAHGNIRVVVDPDEAAKALDIIRDWEQKQVPLDPAEGTHSRKRHGLSIFPFILGVIAASAALLWNFSTPFYENTADYNRDGQADEWVYWRGGNMSRMETDRNHDGEVDSVFFYSPRNGVEKGEFDNDFNGTFEEKLNYLYAQPISSELDVDSDGITDFKYYYEHGVLTKIEIFVPGTPIVKKVQTYQFGITLTEALWDSNEDGNLDTLIKYGPYEEELSRTPIPE